MSQPFNQATHCKPLGEVDASAGQFWVGNPWLFGVSNKNLSCYERNRVYANRGDGRFVEVSWITGADDDADSRGAVGADLDGDGRVDLLTRQVGGGPLKMYRNRFPRRAALTVRLHGTRSNTQGLGARLVAEVGGRRLARELWSTNTFWAQGPAEVTFGLGDATKVDRLTVRWPSGVEQAFTDVAVDQAILLDEAQPDVTTLRRFPPR